jgi:hypothetical protein
LFIEFGRFWLREAKILTAEYAEFEVSTLLAIRRYSSGAESETPLRQAQGRLSGQPPGRRRY